VVFVGAVISFRRLTLHYMHANKQIDRQTDRQTYKTNRHRERNEKKATTDYLKIAN